MEALNFFGGVKIHRRHAERITKFDCLRESRLQIRSETYVASIRININILIHLPLKNASCICRDRIALCPSLQKIWYDNILLHFS